MDQSVDSRSQDQRYFYGIRLLVTHPTARSSDVSVSLDMEPDVSWNPGDRSFAKGMMWGRVTWTEGSRLFFDETHDVLTWLNEKRSFVEPFLSTGGEIQLIIQLPGSINVGDTLRLETLQLAAQLGVRVGVEVFPNLKAGEGTTATRGRV